MLYNVKFLSLGTTRVMNEREIKNAVNDKVHFELLNQESILEARVMIDESFVIISKESA